jgi:hypothetical protein
MTSERKVAANRANAKFSTGPKSVSGRRRSSQNARRHGLSAQTLADRNLSVEAERLAGEIAGPTNDRLIRDAADRVSQALIELDRIQTITHALISEAWNEGIQSEGPMRAVTLDQLTIWLERLDRYKRRAVAKRRKAIKRLDLARRPALAF